MQDLIRCLQLHYYVLSERQSKIPADRNPKNICHETVSKALPISHCLLIRSFSTYLQMWTKRYFAFSVSHEDTEATIQTDFEATIE